MKRILFIIVAFTLVGANAWSQESVNAVGQTNVISTAAPFLNIAPESRGGAMGDAGVASSPDINSQHWNPAKYAFLQQDVGASLSYTPWLRALTNDISIYYLTGFYRLDKEQTVSGSLRYFDLGSINFTDEEGVSLNQGKPSEFAVDVAYARLLSKTFSGSVALRYIHSDLMNGVEEAVAGNAYAADISFFYKNSKKRGGLRTDITAGLNISNLGSKIDYGTDEKDFLPANIRLGGAYKVELDKYNTFEVAIDLTKLLVPTPIPYKDGKALTFDDINNSGEGISYVDYWDKGNDLGVPAAIFGSFSDAPGGSSEELQEINYSIGAEYWYDKQFAIRAGYFHEHENKGNRKFFTAGVGLRFSTLEISASYLVPTVQNNPLANTLRITLGFNPSQLIK